MGGLIGQPQVLQIMRVDGQDSTTTNNNKPQPPMVSNTGPPGRVGGGGQYNGGGGGGGGGKGFQQNSYNKPGEVLHGIILYS